MSQSIIYFELKAVRPSPISPRISHIGASVINSYNLMISNINIVGREAHVVESVLRCHVGDTQHILNLGPSDYRLETS